MSEHGGEGEREGVEASDERREDTQLDPGDLVGELPGPTEPGPSVAQEEQERRGRVDDARVAVAAAAGVGDAGGPAAEFAAAEVGADVGSEAGAEVAAEAVETEGSSGGRWGRAVRRTRQVGGIVSKKTASAAGRAGERAKDWGKRGGTAAVGLGKVAGEKMLDAAEQAHQHIRERVEGWQQRWEERRAAADAATKELPRRPGSAEALSPLADRAWLTLHDLLADDQRQDIGVVNMLPTRFDYDKQITPEELHVAYDQVRNHLGSYEGVFAVGRRWKVQGSPFEVLRVKRLPWEQGPYWAGRPKPHKRPVQPFMRLKTTEGEPYWIRVFAVEGYDRRLAAVERVTDEGTLIDARFVVVPGGAVEEKRDKYKQLVMTKELRDYVLANREAGDNSSVPSRYPTRTVAEMTDEGDLAFEREYLERHPYRISTAAERAAELVQASPVPPATPAEPEQPNDSAPMGEEREELAGKAPRRRRDIGQGDEERGGDAIDSGPAERAAAAAAARARIQGYRSGNVGTESDEGQAAEADHGAVLASGGELSSAVGGGEAEVGERGPRRLSEAELGQLKAEAADAYLGDRLAWVRRDLPYSEQRRLLNEVLQDAVYAGFLRRNDNPKARISYLPARQQDRQELAQIFLEAIRERFADVAQRERIAVRRQAARRGNRGAGGGAERGESQADEAERGAAGSGER